MVWSAPNLQWTYCMKHLKAPACFCTALQSYQNGCYVKNNAWEKSEEEKKNSSASACFTFSIINRHYIQHFYHPHYNTRVSDYSNQIFHLYITNVDSFFFNVVFPCCWSNHPTSVKWKFIWLDMWNMIEFLKRIHSSIPRRIQQIFSSCFSHLLHCEDSTYNMAAQTSISGLQWKGGWIFSLLGFFPNKIQASARNLNSTSMAPCI